MSTCAIVKGTDIGSFVQLGSSITSFWEYKESSKHSCLAFCSYVNTWYSMWDSNITAGVM